MFISGANNLYNNKKTVDDLNVFPVPDGDTGTNMSLTIMAMAKELSSKENLTLTKAADVASFATLRGARGNSGVILSQFFRGISKSLKGKNECEANEFAKALSDGAAAAYKAVMKPTEGTILTVAREAAEGAKSIEDGDITAVITAALERGEKALLNTPEQLPALKQAGVVDAGGQGWIYVLEGALHYLKTGNSVEAQIAEEPAKASVSSAQGKVSTSDIKFKYCTEFLIEKAKDGADTESFKKAIAPKGDCMLVIDDDDIVKVHIHTNHPGFVLEEAVKVGEMINLKIDNMKHQHKSIINADAPATEPDKKPKKPKKTVENKEYGFVAVCAGKGLISSLKELGVDRVIEGGQTMNPSTDDILKAVKRVNAKTVFMFPNNKNIIMAANQAADLTEDKKLVVIPTKNIPQCVSAMVAFNAQKDAQTNERTMTKAAESVKSGQLTYAVRDTEIDGVSVKKDDILGIVEGEIAVAGKERDDVLDAVVEHLVDDDTEYITVYYGKDVKKAEAENAASRLEKKYAEDEIEVSVCRGGQPLYYYIVSVE